MGCFSCHTGGHIQPPSSMHHTEAKGRWGQTAFGLQNSQEKAKECNWHLLQMGRKHPQAQSTQTHWLQRPVCIWAKKNWRCKSFKNCLGEHDGCWRCQESFTAGLSRSGDDAQKHHPASALRWSFCNPLPLNDKGVRSFPSCCIPLRRTRAAPFLQRSPVYLVLMCLAPWDPSCCNSR